MDKEELIKNQFPNDEFLQSGVSQIVDKCIADLEKENAELDMKRKAERQIFQGIVEKKNEQLTKAKEIIKDFLLMAEVEHLKDRYETVDEAEQFLKE